MQISSKEEDFDFLYRNGQSSQVWCFLEYILLKLKKNCIF